MRGFRDYSIENVTRIAAVTLMIAALTTWSVADGIADPKPTLHEVWTFDSGG